ncbi:DUF692 domain-containing protein [Methylophaga nitratireducenticrescens]|uniref:UPF0276 protein Q7A_2184 n=1 Tax=Methylophaga nitratireducenticrescens TaxID=754476 RepID=I1XKS9_METNJ|nr:DUF692 domain-containing protein [Methylophaga nitratireducenticrescens]AFI84998.1 hypothetical protein Q7A_2184 [Methylophaga nitratireducenticrescens]AUZ85006.1 hypothetical protein CDW43_10655 [Methylophaga nitratireducenticrescens]
MRKQGYAVNGAGLGLRRSFIDEIMQLDHPPIDFIEVAPENWMEMGGRLGKKLQAFSEHFPMLCHGLSLSLGSPAPLDEAFVKRIKHFLDQHQVRLYSEHLSYCSDEGHLYDLMPIPFTDEAVEHVAERILRVQDILQRRLIIENVSYYAAPGRQIDEIEFINAILEKADCELLLDVNNVYVNSINHGYDAKAYIDAINSKRIAYMHIAGHYNEAEDLIIDTHGADVIDPVWRLLEHTYQQHGVIPTLLERDFNIPDLSTLFDEVGHIRYIQSQYRSEHAASA